MHGLLLAAAAAATWFNEEKKAKMLPPAAGAMVDVSDANACGGEEPLGKTPFELASGEGGEPG